MRAMFQQSVRPNSLPDPCDEIQFAFHYASELRDRGWSLIPMRGKVPAIAWSEYQSRRSSLEEVSGWFGENRAENFNIGIVTGRVSDLVVVDADSAEDAAFWEQQHPTPFTVMSGGDRGGRHFYFRTPPHEDVRNRVSVDGRKIDIRGEGGVIVAPGSIHPGTGKAYEWLTPIEHLSLDELPAFQPSWIPAKQVPRVSASTLQGTAWKNNGKIKDIRAYIRSIQAVSGEGGDRNCFIVACLLREAGLSATEALSEIRAWNKTNAHGPFTDKALVHKIESAFSVPARR